MTWTPGNNGNGGGGSGGGNTTTVINQWLGSNVATKPPVVVFLLDDTTVVHYDTLNMWTSRGMAFTTGLRLDFVTGTLTYDKLRTMQNQGMEIAYHGKMHDAVGSGTVTLAPDISEFLTTANAENLKIDGYIGPSGTYNERIVFHDHFHTFKWARGAGATNGVANVRDPVDFFKLIKGSFIDDLTTQTALDTLKPKIDALSARGTGVITLSMHMTSTHATYVDQLLAYIQTKGNIKVMTARDAYEIYGAVIELYDDSLTLGDDFTKRENGNGGTTINSASPHFVLMKDGTFFSNAAAAKMITPLFKKVALNGNTLPDAFPVGLSIIQYGSTDSWTGFPAVGSLYNFNLGKNAGQQFQLYKALNKGGLYFREANTDNTWKTPISDNKLGIFRTAKPTTPTSAGFPGDYSGDANYLYICYAENTWIRVPKDNTWI